MFVITGGGSGIGRALAQALAQYEKKVVVIGRREEQLKETASYSNLIDYCSADVSTEDGLERIRSFLDRYSRIEGLIHNAGTLEPIAPIMKLDRLSFHQALTTNVDPSIFLTQLLLPKLTEGRVLHIGSGAAYFAIKGWSTYCISKAALSMVTRCWQLESEAVYFASAMPGITDTHMQKVAREGKCMDPEQVTFYQKLKDQKRLISPETVAEFLSWLLLKVDSKTFCSQEWDIYDTKHHSLWLKKPHQILHWDI